MALRVLLHLLPEQPRPDTQRKLPVASKRAAWKNFAIQ